MCFVAASELIRHIWVPMPNICIINTQTTFSYLCYGLNTAHQKRGMCIGDNLENVLVSVTSRKKPVLLISRSTHKIMLFASKFIYTDPTQVTAFTLLPFLACLIFISLCPYPLLSVIFISKDLLSCPDYNTLKFGCFS